MKAFLVAVILLGACGDDGSAVSVAELQDPATCVSCHPSHHDQWSGSMHAYASTDPVFRAMHARGQRETDGELGMFCVNCHAPMAVANKTITADNVREFDFATLAPNDTGVTCYFCHNVDKVTDDHNNPLVLAMDQTMRGGLKSPVSNPVHRSAYAEMMDGEAKTNNSEMCGACHDIVNQAGVHVERTFAEWKATIFATTDDPLAKLNCSSCHMRASTDVVADAPDLDVPLRNSGFHNHTLASVDQALTPFPRLEEQATEVAAILTPSLRIVSPLARGETRAAGGICLDPPGLLTVRVDTINLGHNFPSGAAFDRRAWLEVIAYDASGTIVFSSGVVPDGMDPEAIGDPNLFGLWDRATKADGSVAHFLWEVAAIDPNPAFFIPGPTTFDPNAAGFDHSRKASFNNLANIGAIDRITARVLMRPLSYELLHDLVDSGDLDAAIPAQLKTLVLTTDEWLRSTAGTGQAMFTNCAPK